MGREAARPPSDSVSRVSHAEGEQILDVTIEAVRDRFHTLNVPLAYFDGPAGTQVPDSVLEAVSGYLLAANANAGGKFVTSLVTDDVIASARAAASDLLGVFTDEVDLRREHDLAQLRALAHRRSRVAGGRRGRRHAPRPRREHRALAGARLRQAPRRSSFCELDGDCRIDLDHLRSLVSRADEGGRLPDGLERGRDDHAGPRRSSRSRTRPARSRGSTRCITRRTGTSRSPRSAATCSSARRTSSSARTSGSPGCAASCSRAGGPTRCGPQSEAPGQPARDGDAAARAPLRLRRGVEYLHGVGWDVHLRPRARARAAVPRRAARRLAAARAADDGGPRLDLLRSRRPAETPAEAAARLGAAGFAVWDGNYYAVEVFKHLGLPEGAVRIGIVHTNMADEVDRLLAALPRP